MLIITLDLLKGGNYKKLFILRLFISLGLLITVGYLVFLTANEVPPRQHLVGQYAEIGSIKYGLFSIHSWKRKVSEILAVKVKEFELNTGNREELKEEIEIVLNRLLDDVQESIEQEEASSSDKTDQGWWQQIQGNIKSIVAPIIRSLTFDIEQLRRDIPQFAENILNELDKNETREKLSLFIQKQIDDLLAETVGEEDHSMIRQVADIHQCEWIEDCSNVLENKLIETDRKLKDRTLWIIGLAVLIFLMTFVNNTKVSTFQYTLVIGLCGMLLFAGVTSPMIDIDARIADFNFYLMGEQLHFRNQILFLESKSILEVVNILISTRDYQSLSVGALVFLFSIVFPFSKLFASLILLKKPAAVKNGFLRFLALKSGKWSMADVFVVAIFMAYIGFKGLISSQLGQLEGMGQNVEILTTDNSVFRIGFILFLTYCLAGLFLADRMERSLRLKTS